MKYLKYILFSLILFFVSGCISAKEITINLFYSETCPHCAAEKEFLEEYKLENKNVKVKLYEVTTNEYNSNLLGNVKQTLAGLKSSSGFIRSRIAEKINLRVTPELVFELDDSMEYGEKIDSILKDIMKDIKPEGENNDNR